MLLIPAIDIKDGRCVRLKQGRMEQETVYDDSPEAVADKWIAAGARRLHNAGCPTTGVSFAHAIRQSARRAR